VSVYYIHSPELGLVKIGFTSDAAKRLSQVRVHSPARLVMLAVEDGGKGVEAQRHRAFADLRVRGEWFRFEGALKAHIEALAPYQEGGRKQHPGALGAWISEHGHTLESFGKLIGTCPATVSRICSGKMSPASFVRQIHEVASGDIDANALFGLSPRLSDAAEPAAATG
jgi:hypothetical protein